MADVLPWNAERCPRDREPLAWASMYGMRVYTADGHHKFYACRCPKCGREYTVKRIDR